MMGRHILMLSPPQKKFGLSIGLCLAHDTIIGMCGLLVNLMMVYRYSVQKSCIHSKALDTGLLHSHNTWIPKVFAKAYCATIHIAILKWLTFNLQ